MLIDFNTGKEIKEDSTLTITQSLVKSGIPCELSSEDFSFEELVQTCEMLSPIALIKIFKTVLSMIKEGKMIDPNDIEYLLKQCEDWEVSDQFAITE